MKLIDFVKDRKVTAFEFTSSEIKPSQTNPGEKIAVLHLAEPIPIVTGSQFVGEGDDRERMQAFDVTDVSIYQRDMADEGIDIQADGSGKVNSDLQLDVANSGEVWLTSETFLAFGRKKSQENRNQRRAGIRNRMEERKAKALLKTSEGPKKEDGNGKIEPTPTTTPAGSGNPEKKTVTPVK